MSVKKRSGEGNEGGGSSPKRQRTAVVPRDDTCYLCSASPYQIGNEEEVDSSEELLIGDENCDPALCKGHKMLVEMIRLKRVMAGLAPKFTIGARLFKQALDHVLADRRLIDLLGVSTLPAVFTDQDGTGLQTSFYGGHGSHAAAMIEQADFNEEQLLGALDLELLPKINRLFAGSTPKNNGTNPVFRLLAREELARNKNFWKEITGEKVPYLLHCQPKSAAETLGVFTPPRGLKDEELSPTARAVGESPGGPSACWGGEFTPVSHLSVLGTPALSPERPAPPPLEDGSDEDSNASESDNSTGEVYEVDDSSEDERSEKEVLMNICQELTKAFTPPGIVRFKELWADNTPKGSFKAERFQGDYKEALHMQHRVEDWETKEAETMTSKLFMIAMSSKKCGHPVSKHCNCPERQFPEESGDIREESMGKLPLNLNREHEVSPKDISWCQYVKSKDIFRCWKFEGSPLETEKREVFQFLKRDLRGNPHIVGGYIGNVFNLEPGSEAPWKAEVIPFEAVPETNEVRISLNQDDVRSRGMWRSLSTEIEKLHFWYVVKAITTVAYGSRRNRSDLSSKERELLAQVRTIKRKNDLGTVAGRVSRHAVTNSPELFFSHLAAANMMTASKVSRRDTIGETKFLVKAHLFTEILVTSDEGAIRNSGEPTTVAKDGEFKLLVLVHSKHLYQINLRDLYKTSDFLSLRPNLGEPLNTLAQYKTRMEGEAMAYLY